MRFPIDVAFCDRDGVVLRIQTIAPWRVTRVVPSAGSVLDFLQGTGGRAVTGVLIFLVVLALISAQSPSDRRPPAVPTGAPA